MSEEGPGVRITGEAVLGVFREREDPSEPLTAPEIADRLDCSRRTALDRLHELADRGVVATKTVGARSRVWWLPETEHENGAIVGDDPLFSADPITEGEPMADDETIDDVVYGDAER